MSTVNILLKCLYWGTIAVHYLVVLAGVLCVLLLWQHVVWYEYAVICGLLGRVVTSREICPLTTLENCIARKIGYTKSDGFLKMWIIAPVRKLWRR